MKKIILLLMVIFISFFNSNKLFSNLIYVLPAGGEVLVNEETAIISFVNSSTFTEFDIYLWDGVSCSWTTIAEGVESTTYSWPVDVESYGDRFRIKVQNSADADDYAFSTGYFSIIEPPEEISNVETAVIIESPELNLFPNPAFSSLNIELSKNLIKTVYFWNLSGKLVFAVNNINSDACRTDLDELPPGQYLVECYSTKGKRFIKKLIIER